MSRPDFIKHWTELEQPAAKFYRVTSLLIPHEYVAVPKRNSALVGVLLAARRDRLMSLHRMHSHHATSVLTRHLEFDAGSRRRKCIATVDSRRSVPCFGIRNRAQKEALSIAS
jgi:hypothetical protein